MPHICNVDYEISRAFDFDRNARSDLVKLIMLTTAKEILYTPFRAIKQVTSLLADYVKRIS